MNWIGVHLLKSYEIICNSQQSKQKKYSQGDGYCTIREHNSTYRHTDSRRHTLYIRYCKQQQQQLVRQWIGILWQRISGFGIFNRRYSSSIKLIVNISEIT